MSILIYLCTNRTTGKRYVGQTTMTLAERWEQHCTRGGNSPFARALRRYGANVWRVRPLEVCPNKRAANIAETTWIVHYNTVIPNGYNVRAGNLVAARKGYPPNAIISEKYIKCSREGCSACPHGPYRYAKWHEGGRTISKYLGKA